jgi:hypothetical protein
MIYYCKLPEFKLSQLIITQLRDLNRRALSAGHLFDKKKLILDTPRVVFDYGWKIFNIGAILSLKVPPDLENLIRGEINCYYGNFLAKEAIIRLQVVFGGSMVPPHIDENRNTSIVYPIEHPYVSLTNFYKYDGPVKRGVLSPVFCQLVDSVQIDTIPVLLNVENPHSVTYKKGTYTKKEPRISLTIKFKNLNFTTVMGLTGGLAE